MDTSLPLTGAATKSLQWIYPPPVDDIPYLSSQGTNLVKQDDSSWIRGLKLQWCAISSLKTLNPLIHVRLGFASGAVGTTSNPSCSEGSKSQLLIGGVFSLDSGLHRGEHIPDAVGLRHKVGLYFLDLVIAVSGDDVLDVLNRAFRRCAQVVVHCAVGIDFCITPHLCCNGLAGSTRRDRL